MAHAVTYKAKSGKTQWKPTLSFLLELESDSLGFCLACGESTDEQVEPDAVRYTCSSCGENKVYGADVLFLKGLVHKDLMDSES